MKCDEVQPAAPSPGARVTDVSPALSPVLSPSAISACQEIQAEFFDCFSQNLITSPSCSEGCQGIGEDDDLPEPTSCEEVASFTCPTFTCCPQCAAIGNKFIGCIAGALFACDETVSCGEFAPVAPSPVAPFAFPPSFFDSPAAPVIAPVLIINSSSSSEDGGTMKKGGKKSKGKGKKGKKGKKRALGKGD